MSQVCLFEEYIYNTFVHFARICEASGRIVFPVMFQKNRLSFNDQIEIEMSLMEHFYSKFRMLGKGSLVEVYDGLQREGKEMVEQIWASKVEFILALKEFYKTNVLPLKREIEPPKIENLVSKKKNDIELFSKQRTKMKDFIDVTKELKKINDNLERKTPKLKTFVKKTILKSSGEGGKEDRGPYYSKATLKLMSIQKLLQLYKTDPLKLRRFTLKSVELTNQLVINTSGRTCSTMRNRKTSDGSKIFLNNLHSGSKSGFCATQRNKVVLDYLKNKYVSSKKLF
jgi:hypothetical protein